MAEPATTSPHNKLLWKIKHILQFNNNNNNALRSFLLNWPCIQSKKSEKEQLVLTIASIIFWRLIHGNLWTFKWSIRNRVSHQSGFLPLQLWYILWTTSIIVHRREKRRKKCTWPLYLIFLLAFISYSQIYVCKNKC